MSEAGDHFFQERRLTEINKGGVEAEPGMGLPLPMELLSDEAAAAPQ